LKTLPEIDLAEVARFGAPRNENGPVFAEPWQARAFALVVKLVSRGHFTWQEWTQALIVEVQHASEPGVPDDGSRYYHHWLAALEHLVTAKGLASSAELGERTQAAIEAHGHADHAH
jgi:nitrile hydratase accessory protein